MPTPVILQAFDEGNPPTVAQINSYFRTLANAVNALAGETIIEWSSATPEASEFLPTAGGSMSGPLFLVGDASSALHAVPKQQLDATAATLMPKAGGTFTGLVKISMAAPGLMLLRSGGDRLVWAVDSSQAAQIYKANSSDAFVSTLAQFRQDGTIYTPKYGDLESYFHARGFYAVGGLLLLSSNTVLTNGTIYAGSSFTGTPSGSYRVLGTAAHSAPYSYLVEKIT